jgi:hypothetical protein
VKPDIDVAKEANQSSQKQLLANQQQKYANQSSQNQNQQSMQTSEANANQ